MRERNMCERVRESLNVTLKDWTVIQKGTMCEQCCRKNGFMCLWRMIKDLLGTLCPQKLYRGGAGGQQQERGKPKKETNLPNASW